MKYLLFLLVVPFVMSCDGEHFNNRNPYIPNYSFSFTLDTNLPAYSQLQYAGNSYRYFGQNAGARGVIVFNSGSGIKAYDAACPNQELSTCSTMTTTNGSNATCPCDDAVYSLFTGESPGLEYPMKPYRTEVNGTLIKVYN
jgi:nitrite reductase/ring-hydroxylating ferredoxin subunit